MPASETSATDLPFAERVEQTPMRRRAAVLVIGRDPRVDAVAVEQPLRDARVLAGDDVGAGERIERADA